MAKRKPHSMKKKGGTPLSKYLSSHRIKKGWSQMEVAQRVKKSKSWICRIERGNRQNNCLKSKILYELAIAYDADINIILRKAKWPQLLLIDIDIETQEQIKQYIRSNL